MRVLYLGDGPLGGTASYLYGALTYAGFQVDHVVPGKRLSPQMFKKDTRAIIASDYSFNDLKPCESLIHKKITEDGLGFLMVGGWGSFSGGTYRGSLIENVLPVRIKTGDDRLNYSPGLRLFPRVQHPLLKSLSFQRGPIICGLNRVIPKRGSNTVLGAFPLVFEGSGKVHASKKAYPLLVIGKAGAGRTAAFTSDFAPHWAGGLLDWGSRRLKVHLPKKKVFIEVGNDYIQFIQNLLNWLGGK